MPTSEPMIPTVPAQRPLYQQVEAYVRMQIRKGELVPGRRLDPTDLARRTNISRPVVQQALQSLSSQGVLVRRPRSGTYVADDAALRIDDQQAAGATRSLAVIVPYIHLPEYARLAEGVAIAARTRGLDLIIAGTDNSVELYEETIRRHLRATVFGMILVPPLDAPLPLSLLQEIDSSMVPVVCCYRRVADDRWPVVMEDGEHAGYMAAEHLIKSGRRNLCFVGDSSPPPVVQSPTFGMLFQGFTRAAMQHLREVDEVRDLQVRASYDAQGWNRSNDLVPMIRGFLEEHPQLDGFFCHNSGVADTLYHVLCDLGRSIPQDAAIVANGDFLEYASYARQELSTIAYSHVKLGEELLGQLIAIRDGARSNSYEPIYVCGELCVRNSSTTATRT